MNLKKDVWAKDDIILFQEYLESLKNEHKMSWAKNILKTDMTTLALKTIDMQNIVKDIFKGNYISYLEQWPWNYYENTAIIAMLLNRMKDFPTYVKYLDKYVSMIDNWASCDVLTYNIKAKEEEFFLLSNKYIKSSLPFQRRVGINILFKYIELENYLPKIFELLNSFESETHYYVNMVNAWLLCECFIKRRNETLAFFKDNSLNRFTQNKAIQKCRESNRVSKEDKDMLLMYKRKGKD